MQSIHEHRYPGLNDFSTAASWVEGMRATPKAATHTAAAGLVILVLLSLASLAFVVLGGTFALETSPLPEVQTSKTEAAAIAADVGGALDKELMSVRSAQPTDYFPEAYSNRGRDGIGNVATYEHD